MKKRMFLMYVMFVLLVACGGNGNDVPSTNTPQQVSSGVKEYTVYGDSISWMLAGTWSETNEVENRGIPGVKIDFFLDNPETRTMKKVVMIVGTNNLTEEIEVILDKYTRMYNHLKSKSERVICVGISPVASPYHEPEEMNKKIETINAGIYEICGFNNFVRSWTLHPELPDGVHHSKEYDQRLITVIEDMFKIHDITIYGDSTALTLGINWGGDIQLIAELGYPVSWFANNHDTRTLKNVVVLAGINDLGYWNFGEPASVVIENYARFIWSIRATGRVFAVGLTPLIAPHPHRDELNPKIVELNNAIKGLVGEENFIDTSEMATPENITDDGLHHTPTFDHAIRDEILKRLNN